MTVFTTLCFISRTMIFNFVILVYLKKYSDSTGTAVFISPSHIHHSLIKKLSSIKYKFENVLDLQALRDQVHFLLQNQKPIVHGATNVH